jgi:peptidyl-prolyl cis-trans isomerase A (cyclophilin A)
MPYKLLGFIFLSLVSACRTKTPEIIMQTQLGEITLELYEKSAPITVHNFLHFVDTKMFDGAEFYRVVTMNNQPGGTVKIEVVQGGLQYVRNIDSIPGIRHETTALSGIHHLDGTISMARDKPGSASTEFFICIGDQPELDFGGKRNSDGQGFSAFGKVISGMEIIRKIHQMNTDSNQILINRIRIDRVYLK